MLQNLEMRCGMKLSEITLAPNSMNTRKLASYWLVLLFVPLIVWQLLIAKDSDMRKPDISLPLIVASEVELKKSDRGLRVAKMYGVDKPVESIDLAEPKNLVAVYSDDPGLKRYVGYHFGEMADDPEFTGDTWYSSRMLGGFELYLVKYDADGSWSKTEATVDAASIVIWQKEKK